MKAQVNFDSLGGGAINVEWKKCELSNNSKTASTSWDYDADSCMVIFNYPGGTRFCAYFDVTTSGNRGASNVSNWYGQLNLSGDLGITNVTCQKRSFSITASSAISYVYVAPMQGKITELIS